MTQQRPLTYCPHGSFLCKKCVDFCACGDNRCSCKATAASLQRYLDGVKEAFEISKGKAEWPEAYTANLRRMENLNVKLSKDLNEATRQLKIARENGPSLQQQIDAVERSVQECRENATKKLTEVQRLLKADWPMDDCSVLSLDKLSAASKQELNAILHNVKLAVTKLCDGSALLAVIRSDACEAVKTFEKRIANVSDDLEYTKALIEESDKKLAILEEARCVTSAISAKLSTVLKPQPEVAKSIAPSVSPSIASDDGFEVLPDNGSVVTKLQLEQLIQQHAKAEREQQLTIHELEKALVAALEKEKKMRELLANGE